jgi:hypothetical protein
VVEDDSGEAGLGEPLGESAQAVATRSCKPVGHDDDRRQIAGPERRVEPGGAAVLAGYEGDLLTTHRTSNAGDPEIVRPVRVRS